MQSAMMGSLWTISQQSVPNSAPENKRAKRKTKGGGGNSGEGKTHHKTPPQKRFWTPPLMIRFPPPFVYAVSFSLEETGTDQTTNPTFAPPPKLVLEGVLYGTFSPPKSHDTFCPPPLRIPKKRKKKKTKPFCTSVVARLSSSESCNKRLGWGVDGWMDGGALLLLQQLHDAC